MPSPPASTSRGLCAHCGTSPEKAFHCSTCCVTMYCGKECQTAHWRAAHKRTCDQIRGYAYNDLLRSRGGTDTLNKLLQEAFDCADPRPEKRRPVPQALTPQMLDRLLALATARRTYIPALCALIVRAFHCWQDPCAVGAQKRAYVTKLLEMRAKDETEDRYLSFVATTAAAALLYDVGDMQELVKVSKDCLSHLKDATLDVGDRIWVYKRLGCVLLQTKHASGEMDTELSLAAEACFRAALDLSTCGGVGTKDVAELKLLLGEVFFNDDRLEECVCVMTSAYEELKAQPSVNDRMLQLIEMLYEIDFSTGRYQDALELATRGLQLAGDTDAVLMGSLLSGVPPSQYFMLLMAESAQAIGDQDLVDEMDRELKARIGAELVPLDARVLGPAFATREGHRLIRAGRLDDAEGWLQAAVDTAKYQASLTLFAWGMEQRALEPQEMLLGLLEARGTPEAVEMAGRVREELRAAAKVRDELQAQTLAEARDIIRSRTKKGRTSKKQAVPSSATDDVVSSEVTAAEDPQARKELEAPTLAIMGEEEEDLCSLCLDQMEPMRDAKEEFESPVCVQECGHRHHDACLDHMVEFQLKKGLRELECPICRTPLLRVRRWCVEQ